MSQENEFNGITAKIPFQNWKIADLEKKIGLVQLRGSAELDEWVSAVHPISPPEFAVTLDFLRSALEYNRTVWNEMELRTEFIGPLTAMAGFYGEGFSAFAGRQISGRSGEYELFGEVDWMAATGRGEPQTPFFFLHEYKKSAPGNPDPFGQLLAAMLVAQTQNDDGQPIYGVLVMGEVWRFAMLMGKQYVFSHTYDATDPTELPQIWSILQETKNRIVQRVAELQAEGRQPIGACDPH